MPSKKLQVQVDEKMLEEMERLMTEEMYFEMSEFVKHCIRQYLISKRVQQVSHS